MKWKPLQRSGNTNADLPELPGERGRYLLFLGTPFIDDGPRWVHFSWRGESFAIRDFLRGRMSRQEAGATATDVWRAAVKRLPGKDKYYHSVDDVDWWVKELKKL